MQAPEHKAERRGIIFLFSLHSESESKGNHLCLLLKSKSIKQDRFLCSSKVDAANVLKEFLYLDCAYTE
jgi:hypothetical protein